MLYIIASVETKSYTAEEYLEAKVNSQDRHEFINGEMVLMTGDTPNHNIELKSQSRARRMPNIYSPQGLLQMSDRFFVKYPK
ncbi:Uma2 family endonuclease [Microcoleus vaginatus GB1-A2]|uniref:hypothetical protein n=1 Tax=Microcoleus vaginatus TaxID=119532 RepID=UPI0032AC6ADF